MHRYYGYRRINVLLQREGWAVGTKTVHLSRTSTISRCRQC